MQTVKEWFAGYEKGVHEFPVVADCGDLAAFLVGKVTGSAGYGVEQQVMLKHVTAIVAALLTDAYIAEQQKEERNAPQA